MHQPFSSVISKMTGKSNFSYSRSLAIHGAGSTGVKRNHLGLIGKNSYSIYKFDNKKGISVSIRSQSEYCDGFEEAWKCYFSCNPDGGLRAVDSL
jgi:hypothetical protein